MFLGGVGIAFIGEHFEGVHQPRAGLLGFDHIIDITAGSGDVRVGELLTILRHQFSPARFSLVPALCGR